LKSIMKNLIVAVPCTCVLQGLVSELEAARAQLTAAGNSSRDVPQTPSKGLTASTLHGPSGEGSDTPSRMSVTGAFAADDGEASEAAHPQGPGAGDAAALTAENQRLTKVGRAAGAGRSCRVHLKLAGSQLIGCCLCWLVE
jgi:hypothetical protein